MKTVFVFIKKDYTRDAQGLVYGNASLDNDETDGIDDGYGDINCPALAGIFHESLLEVKAKIHNMYPDASDYAFELVEVNHDLPLNWCDLAKVPEL